MNKHRFQLRQTPKELFNHSYYLPRDKTLETYNNSVLLQPKSGCGDSHSVHFIVASSPHDVNIRDVIRETWGSVSRGLPWPGKDLSLSVRLTFVLGVEDRGNGSLHPEDTGLAGEEQWDDILQFDMIDSYQNLTRKILLAMQWVVSSCKRVQYIVKVDQDNFANVPLLVSFLKHYGRSNSLYGYMYTIAFVNRSGKWEVPRTAYPPPKYPVYASGTTYVLSRSAVETVLKLCPYYYYVPIEDAFITGILASIGSVDQFNVNGFNCFLERKPTPCDFIEDRKYAGNNMDLSDFRITWKRLEEAARGVFRC